MTPDTASRAAPVTGSDHCTDVAAASSSRNATAAARIADGSGPARSTDRDAAGSTTVTFTDALGNTVILPVTVPASPAPVININPAGLTGGQVGVGTNVLTLMPTEAGYSGGFTATTSNGAIAQVVAVPLTNDFAVTTASQGPVILTVRDTNGNSASIGFTVQ